MAWGWICMNDIDTNGMWMATRFSWTQGLTWIRVMAMPKFNFFFEEFKLVLGDMVVQRW
jgi:hypothetical protein